MRRFGLDLGTSNTSLAQAAGDAAPVLLPLDPVARDANVLRTLLYYSPTLRAFVVGQRAIDEYLERAKTRLSTDAETTISFHRAGIDIEERLTRTEFEKLIARAVADIEACLAAVLARAGIGDGEVASVFLTGGTAQIPALRGLFARRFGENRLRAQDYLTTVACGLARA